MVRSGLPTKGTVELAHDYRDRTDSRRVGQSLQVKTEASAKAQGRSEHADPGWRVERTAVRKRDRGRRLVLQAAQAGVEGRQAF
jgi:hypothetical protein